MVDRRWYPEAWERDLVEGPPDKILSVSDLEPYQKWMAERIVRQKGLILAAQMSLGKTASCLLAATHLLREGVIKKWLIVAPLRVAEETWPDEIWKWSFSRDHAFSCILGDERQRTKAALSDAPFHIINRENLTWLWKTYRHAWPYDGLIYDECSRLKAGRMRSVLKKDTNTGRVSGGRMNEFGSLVQMVDAGVFKRRVGLSGTPTPNGLIDWWGQIYLVDGGERLGKKREMYVDRWFNTDRYSHRVSPREGAESEIMLRLADVVYSLKTQDHLMSKLPTALHLPRWVEMPTEAMKTYKQLQRDYALEEHDIAAVNGGVLTNKLLQLANGFVYNTSKMAVEFHHRKLEELEAIHHDAGGRPVFVVYNFKEDLARIRARFPGFRVFGESTSDMADWNAGKIEGLLVHPQSAGHGLNFQFGGNIVVWYGLTWSLESFQQTNKRLDRRGQKEKNVFIYYILAKNTFDKNQFEALSSKDATQERVTNAVRILRETIDADNARSHG